MSILYAGGLWTIAVIAGLACGYIWALNFPRWGYKIVLGWVVLTIIVSQYLPSNHLLNISVSEGLHWWLWALAIGVPILLYAMAVRWLKQKASARHDS